MKQHQIDLVVEALKAVPPDVLAVVLMASAEVSDHGVEGDISWVRKWVEELSPVVRGEDVVADDDGHVSGHLDQAVTQARRFPAIMQAALDQRFGIERGASARYPQPESFPETWETDEPRPRKIVLKGPVAINEDVWAADLYSRDGTFQNVWVVRDTGYVCLPTSAKPVHARPTPPTPKVPLSFPVTRETDETPPRKIVILGELGIMPDCYRAKLDGEDKEVWVSKDDGSIIYGEDPFASYPPVRVRPLTQGD